MRYTSKFELECIAAIIYTTIAWGAVNVVSDCVQYTYFVSIIYKCWIYRDRQYMCPFRLRWTITYGFDYGSQNTYTVVLTDSD